jgi:hypothetical protein
VCVWRAGGPAVRNTLGCNTPFRLSPHHVASIPDCDYLHGFMLRVNSWRAEHRRTGRVLRASRSSLEGGPADSERDSGLRLATEFCCGACCRVCWGEERKDEVGGGGELVVPCKCSGSMVGRASLFHILSFTCLVLLCDLLIKRFVIISQRRFSCLCTHTRSTSI